ncbi:ATP-binding protein [Azospirillum soli]|uniref:ATP-binding protein n=1 Tax=Azospirillum soli TaxID=1304799 RepID=UPI001AEA1DB6|nr:ATP-binding protein [Azospirillum soli]MBP2314915.1 signal transduction histidine kinase [Azospirillum soli]
MQRSRSVVVIALATVCLLTLQAAATWLLVERGHANALSAAGQTVTRALGGAAANINRGLLQVDALLAGLDTLVTLPDAGTGPNSDGRHSDGPTANRSLRTLSDQSFLVREMMVVATDGRVLASGLEATRQPPPTQDLIRTAQDPARRGVLVIGTPMRNRHTGEWSLYAARLVTMHGTPVVAMAEMPLPNLARLVLPEASVPGLHVSVERTDGRLLVSNPHDARRIGQVLAPATGTLALTGDWALVPDRFGSERSGSGRVIAAATSALYDGLLLVAQIEEDVALAAWKETRQAILTVSGGIALGLILAAAAGVLYLRGRERAAAELSWSKHLLEQALDSMSEGFVVYDVNRRLVVANRRYLEIFPYLRDLIVPGMPFERVAERASSVLLPHGTEAERRAWAAWRLRAHEAAVPFEQVLPSGRTVQSTQAKMPDGGFVSVHRDVTAAKQAEAQMAAAKEAAERANRTKSEFLSNMSHELRTPLNAIIGFAQVLEEDGAGTEVERAEYARDIRLSGEHLLAIINDVLDMSKLEAGAMTLHESECDLGRLVLRAAGMLREQARAGGVTLRTTAPDEPLRVRADERLIRQVVLNLVSNAVKFTDDGGRVCVAVGEDEDGTLRVEVTDTGMGVSGEHLSKVFQPFYQVDSAASRKRGGTGLGLPISLAIMKMHQGSLDIASEPGCGTTIVATLPAERRLPDAALAQWRTVG